MFICAKCGKVFDFEIPENVNIPMPFPGAKISGMEVRFTGLCEKAPMKCPVCDHPQAGFQLEANNF